MKLQLTKHLTRSLLIAALAVGFTGSALAAAPTDTDAQIHVSGTATRSVAPSYAILRLGITSEASTVGAAKTTNDRVMSDLIARLQNIGISKNNIQTSYFSVSPNNNNVYYANRDNRDAKQDPTYTVSNTVAVRINDMSKISQAIDNAVAAGANNIQSLSFEADVDQNLNDQLTAEAVKNARHQAEVIAGALGQQLAGIKDASVGNTNTYTMESSMRLYKASDMLGSSTPVEQGDITVSKNVDLTFYVR